MSVCPQPFPRATRRPGAMLGCELNVNDRGADGEWQLHFFRFLWIQSVSYKSVTVTAVLWGSGVLWLPLLPCEQFLSFTDS